MATYNYSNQDTKGLKESFDNASPIAVMAYANVPFFTMETSDQFSEIFASTENISGTREYAEYEASDINNLEDGYQATFTEVRIMNAIDISSTDRRKFQDGSVKVADYLMRQSKLVLNDVKYYIVSKMHDLYNNGFVTTYHTAPDSVALFGTHSWNTTGSTSWSNAATAALSDASVAAAVKAGGAFKDGSGKPMPQTYDTIFVKLGSTAEKTALQLFASDITPTHINDVNVYQGKYTIVSSPYLTSDTAWFMGDFKQAESPVFGSIGKFPTMEDPDRQNNLADRISVEGFWKRGIRNLPFNLYGSTGAA